MLDAQFFQIRAFLQRPGGGENLRPSTASQLDRGQTDAARRRMNQHTLAGAEMTHMLQGVGGGQKGDGQRGRFLKRPLWRFGHRKLGARYNMAAEGERRHSQYFVSYAEILYAFSDRCDPAATLGAERNRTIAESGIDP